MELYPRIAIALPALTADIAMRCLKSIDKKYWSQILLVDNTPNGFFSLDNPDHPVLSGVRIINGTGTNIGLPASWNECIKRTVEARYGYDYLVFLSASEIFEYGMRDLMEHIKNTQAHTGYRTDRPAWHCVVLSCRTLNAVGYFDENFWPAYQEDTDYIYRMKLAGLHDRRDELNQMPMVPIAARTTGISLSIKEGGIEVDHEAHKQYYIEKWGGWDGEEKFIHPYNDPTKSLKYWRPREIGDMPYD